MILTAGIILCQSHFTVGFQMIDDADVLTVGAKNFQIFSNERS